MRSLGCAYADEGGLLDVDAVDTVYCDHVCGFKALVCGCRMGLNCIISSDGTS